MPCGRTRSGDIQLCPWASVTADWLVGCGTARPRADNSVERTLDVYSHRLFAPAEMQTLDEDAELAGPFPLGAIHSRQVRRHLPAACVAIALASSRDCWMDCSPLWTSHRCFHRQQWNRDQSQHLRPHASPDCRKVVLMSTGRKRSLVSVGKRGWPLRCWNIPPLQQIGAPRRCCAPRSKKPLL